MMPIAIPAFADNYIWALHDTASNQFDCVDPGDAGPVIDYAKANQLSLRAILLTHHHQDHQGGVPELMNAFPSTKIYGPDDSRIPHLTQKLKQNDSFRLGKNQFTVLFNPGHTSTHISYYESQQGWLFCGDTLFSAGCGRVFDGTMAQLHDSLMMLKELPKTTDVFCGHEYTRQNLRFAHKVEPNNMAIQQRIDQLNTQKTLLSLPSTIEMEQAINPFFRTDKPDVQAFAHCHGANTARSIDVFALLRNEKNKFI